jgi:hypothetical protein
MPTRLFHELKGMEPFQHNHTSILHVFKVVYNTEMKNF